MMNQEVQTEIVQTVEQHVQAGSTALQQGMYTTVQILHINVAIILFVFLCLVYFKSATSIHTFNISHSYSFVPFSARIITPLILPNVLFFFNIQGICVGLRS